MEINPYKIILKKKIVNGFKHFTLTAQGAGGEVLKLVTAVRALDDFVVEGRRHHAVVRINGVRPANLEDGLCLRSGGKAQTQNGDQTGCNL